MWQWQELISVRSELVLTGKTKQQEQLAEFPAVTSERCLSCWCLSRPSPNRSVILLWHMDTGSWLTDTWGLKAPAVQLLSHINILKESFREFSRELSSAEKSTYNKKKIVFRSWQMRWVTHLMYLVPFWVVIWSLIDFCVIRGLTVIFALKLQVAWWKSEKGALYFALMFHWDAWGNLFHLDEMG